MAYTVLHDEKRNIVELRFPDSASINEHIRSRDEAVKLCQEKQTDKLLVHLGNLIAQDTTSKREQLEFADSWDEGTSEEIYIAVVMPEEVKSQNEFYFIVYMSKINGITVKTFYKEDLAVEWLTAV